MNRFLSFLLIFIFLASDAFSIKQFSGYSSKSSNTNYSVLSLLDSKYREDNKWNENYFHDAIFPDQGITIFTNIIFSNSFFDKKSCKLNCIVTFKNNKKYVFNKDFETISKNVSSSNFSMTFDKNFVEFKNNVYKLHIEDSNINLNLNYKIINPPHIFGDGIVNLDSKSFLAFSQPIVGAIVSGSMNYENNEIKLLGRGSLNHDYNVIAPIKNPKKWRSFWLYNDKYSIIMHTFIMNDDTEVDRVIIYKNNKLLKSFLNCGLEAKNFQEDRKTDFCYPEQFSINFTDSDMDQIKANIHPKSTTDKIKVFDQLSPLLHKIVAKTVGEMWAYRFWTDASFTLKINNSEENINISGICNYVDVVK